MIKLDINGTPVLYGMVSWSHSMGEVLSFVIANGIKKVVLLAPMKTHSPEWITYLLAALSALQIQIVIRENNCEVVNSDIYEDEYRLEAKKISKFLTDKEMYEVKFEVNAALVNFVKLGEFANQKDTLLLVSSGTVGVGIANLLAAMKSLGVTYPELDDDALKLSQKAGDIPVAVTIKPATLRNEIKKLGRFIDHQEESAEFRSREAKIYQDFVDLVAMGQYIANKG